MSSTIGTHNALTSRYIKIYSQMLHEMKLLGSSTRHEYPDKTITYISFGTTRPIRLGTGLVASKGKSLSE